MTRINSRSFPPRPVSTMLALALGFTVVAFCGEAQAQARNFRKLCEADVQKFCTAVEAGGGRVLQCLQSHTNELTPDCKEAIDALSARIKEKRS